MLQQTRYQNFLDQFTEQVVLALLAGMREKELEKRESERINKQIEIQKLRQKYLAYSTLLEKTKKQETNIKEKQEAKTTPINQVENKIIKEVSPNELIPSIMHQQTPALETAAQINQQTSQQKIAKKELPVYNLKNQFQQASQAQQAQPAFAKIEPLIQERLITYIECQGQNKNIIIRRLGQTMKTPIVLSKDEIISIIKEFSEKTKIPLVEGMLDARYENIQITAVVSEVLEPSFIIRKDIIPANKPMPTQLQRPLPIAPKQQAQENASKIFPKTAKTFL